MANDKSLYTLLETSFRAAGDGAAFVVPGGRTVTYKALSDDVGRMANALVKLGIKPGDRVMVQVEKSIETSRSTLRCSRPAPSQSAQYRLYAGRGRIFHRRCRACRHRHPKAQLAKIELRRQQGVRP